MLCKVILLSILSFSITADVVQIRPNKFIRAATVIDTTLFSAGLAAVYATHFSMIQSELFHGEVKYWDRALGYALTGKNIIDIRLLIEIYRILESAFYDESDQSQKSEIKKYAQAMDGLVCSGMFADLSAALFAAASQEDNKTYSALLIALAARCLLHLKTTAKPVIECLR